MAATGSDRHGGSVAAFLREADPCDRDLPAHVRLGALYARARHGDVAAAADRLLADDEAGGDLQLHAAMLLARAGDFEGVGFLLRAREGAAFPDPAAADMALRHCARFPLAALAAACVAPPIPHPLLRIPEERVQTLEDLREPLARLATHGTLPGRALGTGVVVQRPLRRPPPGLRHTGFVLLRGPGRPLLVPFAEGDLLNRDTADAIRPGWPAVAAYAPGPMCQMLLLYVLPGRTDLTHPLAEAALGADGGEIGVIAAFEPGGSRYRIITASGRHRLHNYLPDRQKLGGTCIWHPENDERRPLMLWGTTVPAEVRRRVGVSFRRHTQFDYGVRVRTFTARASGGERHEIATRGGQVRMRHGTGDPAEIVYVEPSSGGSGYLFTLEDDAISKAEAEAIVEAWRAANPTGWGVALAAPVTGKPRRCLLVRAHDGFYQVREAEAGALVSFAENEERVYARELEFALAGGCRACLSSGYRPCSTCSAEGTITCPRCGGARHIACSQCVDGKAPCGHCSGTGKRGGGDCRTCRGTGRWNCNACHGRGGIVCGCDRGRTSCPLCDGKLLTRCSCGGRLPATIVRRN